MFRILEWLLANTKRVNLARLKTLSAIVCGAMRMQGVGVQALGRAMDGPVSAKHRIKRVWRFLKNPGMENVEVSRSLFNSLIPAHGDIIVLCDWTDLAPFQQLVLSLPRDGRSLPFLCLTIMKSSGENTMVETEKKILALLSLICSSERNVVIIADRGFGNYRWIKDIRSYGWHFVQRISENHHIDTGPYRGPASGLGIIRGATSKDWGTINWTDTHKTSVRMVTTFERDSKEAWILITDLPNLTPEVIRLYKRRMWTEAMFRDLKNRSWGFGLDQTRLSKAYRHDSLFIILAVAYFFLMAAGAAAEAIGFDRSLKSNTSMCRSLSLVSIGYYFLLYCAFNAPKAFSSLRSLPI